MSSYRSRLLAAWGLAPWLVAFPVYVVGVQLIKLVALPRFLGFLEGVGFILLLAALALAALRPRPLVARWLQAVVFGGAIANMALVGLGVYYHSPTLAPRHVAAAVALAVVGLFVAFARKLPDDQALTLRLLRNAGLGLMAALVPALPYVAFAAWHDHPRNSASPMPPRAIAPRAGAPKRIVLVTFDELRWGSTSLTPAHRDTTPNLLAFANQSTRFSNCHAAGDQTKVSMPTVLSGVRPPEVFGHVYNEMSVLREGSISGVAAFLKAAGYRTGYSTLLVQPRAFGMRDEFDDGWAVATPVDNPLNGHAFVPLAEIARELVPQRFRPHRFSSYPYDVHPIYSVLEQGLALYRAPAERSFVWLHLGMPHHPYYKIPPADFGKVIKPTDYRRIHPFVHGHLDDPAFYESAYDQYLRYTDAMFARLIAGLKASPEWKDTLVIVTADHGTRLRPELPGPYGVGEVPEDITHVPLLIHTPGQTSTHRVEAAARHEDIVPTILSQVYPTLPTGFKGAPLLGAPLAADRIGYTWAVLPTDARSPESPHRRALAAYQGRYKLILDHPSDTTRLVDWQQDPDGHHDLSAAHPAIAERLKAWILRELAPS